MSKKKRIAIVLVLILLVLANFLIFTRYQRPLSQKTVGLHVTVKSDKSQQVMQFFYLESNAEAEATFNDVQSAAMVYESKDKEQTLAFALPGDFDILRMDLGEEAAATTIESVEVVYKKSVISVPLDSLADPMDGNDIKNVSSSDGGLLVETKDGDPWLVWDASGWGVPQMVDNQDYLRDMLFRMAMCAVLDLVVILLLIFSGIFSDLGRDLTHNRKLVFRLANNDFRTKFAGSYLGIVWAFIQPIVTVIVYWFVFEKGLKSGGVNTSAGITVPFVLWLVAGLVPWFFFSDALNGGTNALMDYSYLVKKVVFKIDILPMVKVLSALFVHVFFIAFALCLYAAYRMFPDLYTLQIIYYSFCVFMFVLGLSYLTCSFVVFFRDLVQIINIILQVGIWMTPIMWNIDGMELPRFLQAVFKVNPLFYVVAGYRDALINKVWFWEHFPLTLYFWIVTGVVMGIGVVSFKRLKVHFSDVL